MRIKSKYIKIEELKFLNNILEFRLSYSKLMEKYFLSNNFYVKYDKNIEDVDESIAIIPAIANIIACAWAIGADVHLTEIDGTYLESLGKIKSVFKRWYPKLSFSTTIHVEEVVSNTFSNKGYGLLFSGGVDSTASYVRHREKHPELIMIRGADIPLSLEDFWNKTKERYRDFAQKEKTRITFIETNMNQLTNNLLIDRSKRFTMWGDIQYGIALSGLCSPITTKGLGTLFIASSGTPGSVPRGSHPLIDNKISWADVKVVHDGYPLSRQEKIRLIKNDCQKRRREFPILRVCWEKPECFNCGKCEKCLRTITALVLENVDPNRCGFNVEDNIFDYVKLCFIEKKIQREKVCVHIWKNMQKHVPDMVTQQDLYNSKEFLQWFKTFDIEEKVEATRTLMGCLGIIYYMLPKNIQYLVWRVNRIVGSLDLGRNPMADHNRYQLIDD